MLDKPAPDRTAVPWQPEANGWAWTLIFPPRFGYVKFQSAANKGLWVLYVLCYLCHGGFESPFGYCLSS